MIGLASIAQYKDTLPYRMLRISLRVRFSRELGRWPTPIESLGPARQSLRPVQGLNMLHQLFK